MNFVWTASPVILFFWALVAAGSALYAWRVRATYGSPWLIALALLVAAWAVCFGFELAAISSAAKLWWLKAQWVSVVLLPLCWLALAATGSAQGRPVFGRRRWVLWVLIPLLLVLLAWSNERHHLVWANLDLSLNAGPLPLRVERGSFFWLHVFYAVGVSVLVMLMASTSFVRLPFFRRRYAVALGLGVTLPLIGDLLYVTGLDVALPFTYWVGGFLLAWSLYQIRQLNLAPIARSALVEQLPDGVLVLDKQDRVIDCNAAARQILGAAVPGVTGRLAVDVLHEWPDLIKRYGDRQSMQDVITLRDRDYELDITPFSDRLGRSVGRLITVRDITDRLRSAEELDQRTAELRTLLQAFPDQMFRFDAQGCFVGYAASSDAHLSAPPEQLLHKHVSEVLPAPIAEQLDAALQRVQASGEPQAVDYSLPNGTLSDADTLWYEARLFPARHGEVIAVVRDVTKRKLAELAVLRQKELLENLVSVARATSEQPMLEETLQNVLNSGVGLTQADRGSLILLNEQGIVTQALSVHEAASPLERRAFIERILQDGLPGWVVRERQTALVLDTEQDERWYAAPTSTPVRSALAVPILSNQFLLGVLVLTNSRPGHFTTDHVQIMEAAADHMALAVRNARLYEVQRRMVQRQTALYEVLRAVSGHFDLASIANTAVEAIGYFADWPHIALLLADPDRHSWTVRAVHGQPSLALGFSMSIAPDVMYANHIAATLQASTVPSPAAAAARPLLTVPLWHGGTLMGLLLIEGDELVRFDHEDNSLAQSLADAITLSLNNAQLYQYINDERSRLQASIRFNRDGIMLLGMNRRILVINEPALQLLTLPGEPEQWLNESLQRVMTLLRPRSKTVVRAAIAELRRLQNGEEPLAEGDYEIGRRMVHWSSLPVLSSALPIGRLVVLRDVTAEHQLNALREDLTSTMVHDLRNPVAVVLGSLDLLDPAGQPAEQKEVVRVARQGAQRLLDLVNAILDVNRLESGQMTLEREPLNLAFVVAEVIAMQQILATDKQQTLAAHVPADLPLLQADLELIRRVLQNLIGNAIKFTPPGGQILVSAWLVEGPPAQIIVSVKDNGPGLPLDLQSRLFQKFITGRVRGRGSGLGLVFCRLAVEAHGGRIWLEPASGSGADFRMALPVSET